AEEKATNRPSSLKGAKSRRDPPFASEPSEATDTRSVTPVTRSRTNVSATPFVSPSTRFVASDTKEANRESKLTIGAKLCWFDSIPTEETLTRSVERIKSAACAA